MLLVADRRRLLRLDNVVNPARNECLAAFIDNNRLCVDHLLAWLHPCLFLDVCLRFDCGCVEVDDLIVLAIGTFVISHFGCGHMLSLDRLGLLRLVRDGQRVAGTVPRTLHKGMMRVSFLGGGQGSHLVSTMQHLESRGVYLALAVLVVVPSLSCLLATGGHRV